MPESNNTVTVLASLFFLLAVSPYLAAQQPCGEDQLRVPAPPSMLEVDLVPVRGAESVKPLAEWSKVEKLQGFYKNFAVKQVKCSIVGGEEISPRLFVTRDSLEERISDQAWGYLTAGKAFQFYGISRFKVERADKDVTRQFAFPLAGPARIEEVAPEGQLSTVLEDLAQLQLVTVPRLQLVPGSSPSQPGQPDDCFLISKVTLVPSRVFDEPIVGGGNGPSAGELTLNARRLALENVAFEVDWLERLDKEQPSCPTSVGDAYLGRQVRSLNLTVQELVPDLDFITQSIQFWREVERRIEGIRAEDEGWLRELRQKE